MARYRVTVDTGGTFSDFVYLNEETGEVTISKVPSTPDDPSRAILSGIEMLLAKGVRADEISYFCHGTTVGTNALLEGKGVPTGLLVTEGFGAIYPVGEQARPYGAAIFDVMYDKPSLLVPPSATGEVRERVDFRGNVLRDLDEAALRQTLSRLQQQKIESIAVCLLFSFLHPQHEQRVAEIIREQLPGCSISLSSEILPQIREYYRLSTTVINAYLQPILARYIAQLEQRLTGAGISTKQKYIMQSNGGMSTFAASRAEGGGHRAFRAGRRRHRRRLCLPDDGLAEHHHLRHGRHVVRRGADQGWRAVRVQPRQDRRPRHRGADDGHQYRQRRRRHDCQGGPFGALEVGPESAGAVPGPACYSRGGTVPTITDCNLVLGYLSEDNFLGGQMRLDDGAARRAVETSSPSR